MCGIAGLIDMRGRGIEPAELVRMATRLAHRGPDGEGFALLGQRPADCAFFRAEQLSRQPTTRPAGFAHRRLAIIDLSEAGTQPMSTATGDVWVTYNGEIFNYIELRRELESRGRTFRTATDTEVLLQAYEEWGAGCQERFNGMWAFVIWDARRGRILFSRDRFGIKPLYYSLRNGLLAFASEPKALLELPWVSPAPDERGIADYLVHSREDCFSWTFFKEIQRLEPGHCLHMSMASESPPEPRRWWDIMQTLETLPPDDQAARERFLELFESAVRLRLRSDVPVGTCLSGGLDSTAVVCVARPWLEKRNQRSYSAVYDASFDEDETRFIDEVVSASAIENYRVHPTGESLLQDMEGLIECQDEPFGSTCQYAQMKVFQRVRECGTTVVMDGQGCDEELAGYLYFLPVHIVGLLKRGRVRRALHELARYRLLTRAGTVQVLLASAAGMLSHRTMIRWANRYDPSRTVGWVIPSIRRTAAAIEQAPATGFGDALNRRLYEVFSVSSLPALLRYEDRNSMAFGVEARLPFLDHRLVSFLFSLPAEQKIRDGWTKYVMREALEGVIPERIRLRRDKIGFATPEADWFRSSLYGYMKREFAAPRTRNRGLYDVDRLLDLLERNAAGKVDAGRALWRALNLELWFRRFVD
jgi:asparagine synthase (glutamine-hydrolysing)